jgi:peptide/nickel transport system substrate-binding protein
MLCNASRQIISNAHLTAAGASGSSASDAAVVTLEAGGVDWLAGVPGQDARRLQADPSHQVLLTASGGTLYYLGLDVIAPPLADKRVRQAFGYALNRQRLVDTALFGFGRPASIPWPQHSVAYDAAIDQTYTYDPARARQLLDAGGWVPGTVIPLSVPNGVAVSVKMARIVQSDLPNIGVQAAVQTLNLPDFAVHMQRAQFAGAWITSTSFMNLSPATFFETAFAVRVPNGSNFASQRYQDLIDQTIAANNDQQLRRQLQELTQILVDEAFVVPIAEATGQQPGPDVIRAGVTNLTWDKLGGFAYEDVWMA